MGATVRHAREIPDDLMHRLPHPHSYYSRRVKGMTAPDEFGWSSAVCPLARYPLGHRVRIDTKTGHFNCPVCGRGDLLLFEMLLTGRRFKACVLQLIEEADE
jgi:hypothetical protein